MLSDMSNWRGFAPAGSQDLLQLCMSSDMNNWTGFPPLAAICCCGPQKVEKQLLSFPDPSLKGGLQQHRGPEELLSCIMLFSGPAPKCLWKCGRSWWGLGWEKLPALLSWLHFWTPKGSLETWFTLGWVWARSLTVCREPSSVLKMKSGERQWLNYSSPHVCIPPGQSWRLPEIGRNEVEGMGLLSWDR